MNNQCVSCGNECKEEEHVCQQCLDNVYNSDEYRDQGRFAQNGGCMSITLGLIMIIVFVGGIVGAKALFDFFLVLLMR